MGDSDNKQVILLREDLGMSPGKAAAQAAHAAMIFLLEAIWEYQNDPIEFYPNEWEWMFSEKNQGPNWKYGGIKKIILAVKDLEELKVYESLANEEGLKTHMVFDEGLEAITALAIGPDDEEKINKVTGVLSLYPSDLGSQRQ